MVCPLLLKYDNHILVKIIPWLKEDIKWGDPPVAPTLYIGRVQGKSPWELLKGRIFGEKKAMGGGKRWNNLSCLWGIWV
jgi:hypothetical protein